MCNLQLAKLHDVCTNKLLILLIAAHVFILNVIKSWNNRPREQTGNEGLPDEFLKGQLSLFLFGDYTGSVVKKFGWSCGL